MHIKNLAQFRMLGTILKYMLLEDDSLSTLWEKMVLKTITVPVLHAIF